MGRRQIEVEKTGNKNVLFIVSMKFCGVENEEKARKNEWCSHYKSDDEWIVGCRRKLKKWCGEKWERLV